MTVIRGGQGDTPLEKALAAKLVGDMNLLRLKVSARILARGLAPDIYWWDLLQEAFARFLNGTRRCPPDVPFDVFMTGVMRSIRTEYRRRQMQLHLALMRRGEIAGETAAPDPERSLLAQEELEAIGELFADDPPELRLDRLLDALSEDVSLASDAEILEACAGLKIQPEMKGSIAYLGLKKGLFFFPYVPGKLMEPIDPPAGPDPGDTPGLTRRH